LRSLVERVAGLEARWGEVRVWLVDLVDTDDDDAALLRGADAVRLAAGLFAAVAAVCVRPPLEAAFPRPPREPLFTVVRRLVLVVDL